MVEIDEKVEAFIKKVGLTPEQYTAEYEAEAKKYTDNGLEANPLIIFRMIKTRYSSSNKSNAVWYNGYFFGINKPYDKAAETWKEDVAPRIEYYQNKYGDNWVDAAFKAKEVNEKGEFIYHAGNCGYKWMYGMKILESEPKRRMYAILTNEAGETNFTIIYMPDIPELIPIPGQMYKFRAGKAKGTDYWIVNPTTVTRLIEDGGCVTYDQAIEDIDQYVSRNVLKYEEVYDLDEITVTTKSFPKDIQFAITGMMIAGISIVDPAKSTVNYIDTGDIIGDFDENVTLKMEQKLEFNMVNNAVGIGVFVPYFSTPKDGGPKYPSGDLIGFIPNEKLTKIKTVQPNTTTLTSDFD